MKSLNFLEIQSIVEMLEAELAGAPLQDVYCVDEKISFGFYRDHQVKWLVLDLDSFFPFIGLLDEPFRAGPKVTKPISLFVRSRFLGRKLLHVVVSEEGERIIHFEFTDQGEWEFRCIPKQPNLICRDSKNSVSWHKIRDLGTPAARNLAQDLEVRSFRTLLTHWRNLTSGAKASNAKGVASQSKSPFERWKIQREKDVVKKKSAIEKLKDQVQTPLIQKFQIIGEHLKVHGYKSLELDWPQYIDLDKRVSENISFCFAKSKQLQSKSVGAQNRILVLKKELEELADVSFEKFESELSKKQSSTARIQSKPNQEKLSVRQKVISGGSGDGVEMVAYMGKSAQENVKLLKQAKSWHLWFHLKDYPGAYVILYYNKGVRVPDQVVREVATWLVQESFRNQSQLSGLKIAVVYTECRHLKMIKGDRLGRVTYQTCKELVISV